MTKKRKAEVLKTFAELTKRMPPAQAAGLMIRAAMLSLKTGKKTNLKSLLP